MGSSSFVEYSSTLRQYVSIYRTERMGDSLGKEGAGTCHDSFQSYWTNNANGVPSTRCSANNVACSLSDMHVNRELLTNQSSHQLPLEQV
jgi:hypothetical protein